MEPDTVKNIIEAALLASDQPLSVEELMRLFRDSALDRSQQLPEEPPEPEETPDGEGALPENPPVLPDRRMIKAALSALREDSVFRSVELQEIASGFQYRIRTEYAPYIQRLWAERPARYSRALLETLAIIAYRQPVTRGEVEEIRGVSIASSLLKTLREREWIRILGHRDVPGKPALYGTTRAFLDYFGLKTLDEMPALEAIREIIPDIDAALSLDGPHDDADDATPGDATGDPEASPPEPETSPPEEEPKEDLP
uniref:Condensin subunit ScpB n=1 Tax=Candidatus Kentrum sp. DK TaxID=2126562 RepID=A0A450STM4_9GAMM|nr:MAG: condensin subunit ScpB [Candidatus Kentron sp. DK]VFJ68062.1 MAG: condensin subunit ScpB [Candidatus Kentron sp. DK]